MRWSVNTGMNILRRSLSQRNIIDTKTVAQSPSSFVALLFSLFFSFKYNFSLNRCHFRSYFQSVVKYNTVVSNIHLTLTDKLCWNKTNNCALKENCSPSAKLQSTCSYTVFLNYHKWISNVLIKFNNISPQIAREKKNNSKTSCRDDNSRCNNTILWRSVLSRSWHS